MKKIFLLLFFLTFIGSVSAGVRGITHHSRANCGNNETISWDLTSWHWFWVTSEHYDLKTNTLIHTLAIGPEYTWRSAMVDWGEGRGGWFVHGYHWMPDKRGNYKIVAEEIVNDCSIYDGWWDH